MSFVNKIILRSPKAIIYDWHGTLFQLNANLFLTSLNKAIEAFDGKPFTSLAESKSVRHSLATKCKENEQRAFEIFYQEFTKAKISQLDLLPGAEHLLKIVNSLGIPQAIVSNHSQNLLANEVKELSIEHYFGAIIGSTSDAQMKPKPDLIFNAISQLNYRGNNKQLLYIGDTESDVTAAKAAGCTAVIISDQKITTQADIQIPNLFAAIEIFNKQERAR